ncbi:MAG: DMT family transporter [Candidatus Marinimicrobia bacterium]|nr:DMT family transporter [Candidatus Neomarinimicrobiota bacterium]MBT3683623.1 DMT family transporter [Candidatus Neomarinimicrobiota bacterium]MBT3760402.1 DMT family transporter [Candidatus Neomarinimicrobiota bacterium]MBT3896520.1 DMT family transporter [Candidatus Neomarinimicrobiota bacterium]MBT4173566.1 DMT family transporter [Candidatus Neomarinimicrobiota bacterium]
MALIAFAANSVLCRLALGSGAIDASSFTVVRLLSGSIVLLVIIGVTRKSSTQSAKGSWAASFMLFLYAVTFSYAYISLDTGTGALILFASVQITMILLSLISGTRLHFIEWIGVTVAFAGFVYLILPGVTTPSIMGFLLMTIAGIAWGIYTLKGRGSNAPLLDTAYNFFRTTPLVLILVISTISKANYSFEGILLAVISGGITSGIGYTIWYIALGGLSSTQAAVLQLSVPVIAAFGGVIFVAETITFRLAISATFVLGGILMVVIGKFYFIQSGNE